MIIEKLFSSLRSKKKGAPAESIVKANIQQVNYHLPGKEIFLRERMKLFEDVLGANRSKDTNVLSAFIIELSSYDEAWTFSCNCAGEFILLSDKGRRITGNLNWIMNDLGSKNLEDICETLLPETSRSDSFPAPGFGHASFFLIYGRSVYFAKKHIPLLERLNTPFKAFFEIVKKMRENILNSL